MLIAGQPWIEEYKIFLFKPELTSQLTDKEDENDDYKLPDLTGTPLEFAQDRKDERVIWLVFEGGYGGTSFYVPPDPNPKWGEKAMLTGEDATNIVKALKAARKERFST